METSVNFYSSITRCNVSVAGPYGVGHVVVPMDYAVSFAPPTERLAPGGSTNNAPAYKVAPERFNFMGTNRPK